MGSIKLNKARDVYNLECSLCLETFKNPKVLPCLHSFCEVCLETIIKGHERTLICPGCQEDIQIPTKGVDAFPNNVFISNMLNVLAVQSPTVCTNCEDQNMANSRCLDCVENLCEDCVGAHGRIRQTKDHKIVSFEELQNNAVNDAMRCPSFCYVHDREMLKYYCATCDDAICRDCAIYDHREHSYVDLKDAVKTHRPVIVSLLEETQRKTPVIRHALREVTDVAKNLVERRDNMRKMINTSIDKYIQSLEEKRRKLIENVEAIFQTKDLVLKDQQSILEMDLSNLLSSCDFVDNVLSHGNEAEIMAAKKLMTTRLQALNDHKSQTEPEENDVIEFNPKDTELVDAIKNLGYITTSTSFPSLCTAKGLGLSEAKVNHTASLDIITRDRHGIITGKGGDSIQVFLVDNNSISVPCEMEDHQNGMYSISYKALVKGQHTLSVMIRGKHISGSPFEVSVNAGIKLDQIGPLKKMIGQSGVNGQSKPSDESYEPWGVAADSEGLVAITDHYNHRIQIFDTQGTFLHQFGSRGKSDGEMWYPTGVSFDASGNIHVADHGNHRIQVFTQEGQFIRKFGVRGTGDGQLKGPCGITIDNDGRIIVTDRDNHRMQVFDPEGNHLFTFGGYGNAEGKFNSPRHVAVTSDGQIVISDTNNCRVQIFDTSGKFVSKFGTKGSSDGQFICPSGIGVDSEGHVAVADFKNLSVQLFSLDGTFLKKIGKEEAQSVSHFNKPTGLDISRAGNVLVADRGKGKVQVF